MGVPPMPSSGAYGYGYSSPHQFNPRTEAKANYDAAIESITHARDELGIYSKEKAQQLMQVAHKNFLDTLGFGDNFSSATATRASSPHSTVGAKRPRLDGAPETDRAAKDAWAAKMDSRGVGRDDSSSTSSAAKPSSEDQRSLP